jgi:hypothetical protein
VLCPGAMKSYPDRPNVGLLIFVRCPSVLFASAPLSIRSQLGLMKIKDFIARGTARCDNQTFW